MGLAAHAPLLALALGLSLLTVRGAQADAYSATTVERDETFVINDSSAVATSPTSKNALLLIVAAPGTTKHKYIYAQMKVEFDCAANKTRFTSQIISRLDINHYGYEDAPSAWADAAPDTKMGAALAHVCGRSTHVVVPLGERASSDAVADLLIASYPKLKFDQP